MFRFLRKMVSYFHGQGEEGGGGRGKAVFVVSLPYVPGALRSDFQPGGI